MQTKRLMALMLAALAALAAGCAELPLISSGPGQDVLDGEPVEVVRLQEYFPASNSGFGEQARLVVTSQAEWESAWARIWRNHSPVAPAPLIDFEREVVLVAAMGGRPTGGYHVKVQAAAAQADRVVVRVVETSPGGRCVLTMALTEPVDVVKLPRTSLPIEFHTAKEVHDCG